MPLLYSLHLSRHVAGMVKGPVRGIAPQGMLFDVDENGQMVVPDRDAIRECLPGCYRKAFERNVRNSLTQMSGVDGFYWRIYNSKGRYLNTLYAVPYIFEAAA